MRSQKVDLLCNFLQEGTRVYVSAEHQSKSRKRKVESSGSKGSAQWGAQGILRLAARRDPLTQG